MFELLKSVDVRISPKDAEYVAPTGAASITMVEQKLQQVRCFIRDVGSARVCLQFSCWCTGQ